MVLESVVNPGKYSATGFNNIETGVGHVSAAGASRIARSVTGVAPAPVAVGFMEKRVISSKLAEMVNRNSNDEGLMQREVPSGTQAGRSMLMVRPLLNRQGNAFAGLPRMTALGRQPMAEAGRAPARNAEFGHVANKLNQHGNYFEASFVSLSSKVSARFAAGIPGHFFGVNTMTMHDVSGVPLKNTDDGYGSAESLHEVVTEQATVTEAVAENTVPVQDDGLAVDALPVWEEGDFQLAMVPDDLEWDDVPVAPMPMADWQGIDDAVASADGIRQDLAGIAATFSALSQRSEQAAAVESHLAAQLEQISAQLAEVKAEALSFTPQAVRVQ